MYRRRPTKALGHREVRELIEAEKFARGRGKPLTTTITVHPAYLEAYPDDLWQWISAFTNKLRIWCERARFGYFGLWVRENYTGDRREHLHLMLYVPPGQRRELEEALRRWLPGDDRVVRVGQPQYQVDASGRRTNKALTYFLKQMTPQAWYALGRQVPYEKESRRGEAVAPVMGKRCGVSRSLNAKTRSTFWSSIKTPTIPAIATPAARSEKAEFGT